MKIESLRHGGCLDSPSYLVGSLAIGLKAVTAIALRSGSGLVAAFGILKEEASLRFTCNL